MALVLAMTFALVVGIVGCKPKGPDFNPQGEEAIYYSMSQMLDLSQSPAMQL